MKAIDKIRDELAKESTNAAVAAIGEMLTQAILNAPMIFDDNILAKDKTIKGAFNAIAAEARNNNKYKVNGGACVPPTDALNIIADYYGIDKTRLAKAYVPQPSQTQSVADEWDIDAI